MFFLLSLLFCTRRWREGGREGGREGEECAARLTLFVLSSLLSRPQAGLATVQSVFFGLAANTVPILGMGKERRTKVGLR